MKDNNFPLINVSFFCLFSQHYQVHYVDSVNFVNSDGNRHFLSCFWANDESPCSSQNTEDLFFHHEHEDNVITSENKDATNISCSSIAKHHALFLDVPATIAEKDQAKLGQSANGCSIGVLDGSPSFDSANEMFNDMHINTSHSGDISPGISGDTSPPILEVIPPDCSTVINNAISFASPETISAFGNIYSTYFYISF